MLPSKLNKIVPLHRRSSLYNVHTQTAQDLLQTSAHLTLERLQHPVSEDGTGTQKYYARGFVVGEGSPKTYKNHGRNIGAKSSKSRHSAFVLVFPRLST